MDRPQRMTAIQREAQRTFRVLRQTLINRGLCQTHKGGGIREVQWRYWTYIPHLRAFAFIVDLERLPIKKEQLGDPNVAEQVSAVLGGRRVHIANGRGMAWLIAYDLPPATEPLQPLPGRVELDLSQRPQGEYLVGLGLRHDGPLWLDLQKACHLMVGGSSDSGKSALLRSLLYQLMVMPDEVEVLLTDMEGRTFSAFEGLPRVRFPVAEDVEDATQITAWLMDEMERRSRLFDATGCHPEKLSEYHQVPGVEHLPWIVAVFDEFTALLDAAGQRSDLYRHVGQLAMRSRKYGMTLVFAGQDFKSDLINSRITNQVRTRIAHRCATRWQSESILLQRGAEQLNVPGRALVSLHGQVQEIQGYWVPKDRILALHEQNGTAGQPALLSEAEAMLVHWSVDHNDGYLSINDMARHLGISPWKARHQAREWARRGWLAKDPDARNKRRVTEGILDLA